MFDVGFWELALLAVIALIVLGPERLPEVARTAGKWVGRVRTYARGFTSELERQANVSGIRDEIDRTREDFNRTRDGIESDTRDVVDDWQPERHSETREQASASQTGDETTPDEIVQADDDVAADVDDIDADLRNIPDDLADYADEEPFSVERAREEHARRDRESQS